MAMTLIDWDDVQAVAVFRGLDPHDQIECELVRGDQANAYGLYADWRSMNPSRLVSLIAVCPRAMGVTPFAVLGVSHSGQAGVAEAALLARNHRHFRRPLAELAVLIRHQLPQFCAKYGIRRIEVRSWSDHPTAGGLLSALGFGLEATMPGFGRTGEIEFSQWAWTPGNQKEQENVL